MARADKVKKAAPAAVVPAADKPKKTKKTAAPVVEVVEESLVVDVPAKKSKKRKAPAVVEEAEVVAVEETETVVVAKKLKKSKKAAENVVAVVEEKEEVVVEEVAPVIKEKKSKKSKKAAAVVVEQEEEAAEPAPIVEDVPVKKSKKSKKAAAPAEDVMEVDVAPPAPAPSTKKTKKAAPAPVEEKSEAEEDTEDAEHLHGFSTDDDDSSDEEDDQVDHSPVGIDVSKLPTVAKDDETVKRKLAKAKRTPTADRGVLYLGRIPHGFFEDQLKSYFGQFGDITRTGASKHYAFLEFASSSVAQIVADTMDNYLLTGHILRCKVIPKDEVHPELWVGANRKWRVVPMDRKIREEHNKPRTQEQKANAESRLLKRQAKNKRKLEEAGIEYDFEGVEYKKKAKTIEA